ETVTRDVLLGLQADTPPPSCVVCVVDASNLERNLYLVSQVLELGLPTVVALNMIDLATAKGETINTEKLSRQLGCPVVACQANSGEGLTPLRLALSQPVKKTAFCVEPPAEVSAALEPLLDNPPGIFSLDDPSLREKLLLKLTDQPVVPDELTPVREKLAASVPDWRDQLITARYLRIQEIAGEVISWSETGTVDLTDRIDAVLTHPVWGWFVFLGLMTLMFLSIFTLASYPMDLIDGLFSQTSSWVEAHMPPGDLRDLLTNGVLAGVGGVVIFLPQIMILFLFIGLLEDTGYMARAAFIMDRVMNRVGLHGKSFIPLLSSYACAIPGVMATRTIENPRDRLATILVAPFMSCSARLPVYALMISTLIPGGIASAGQKAGIMLVMYLLGTAAAFLFALLFKRTFLRGEPPPLVLELPPYRMPGFFTVVQHMLSRAKAFLQRAGTIILGLSILLWFCASYPKNDSENQSERLAHSFAGRAGHFLEPALEPLGFNWKIGIGLIGAQAAREVFVSTVGIVYSIEGAEEDTKPLREALLQDRWPDGRPVFTPLVSICVMVFFVFSMQCIATLAVVKRETNSWRWPIFQFAYMTGFAYVFTLILYQSGRALGF
ncbi:MAG: ferrous iron transport protein B, partial [Opitutaceae bacterium]|nr:ferrous iron transport protein B [Verrucomicrobiales bacterium]